MVPLVVDSLVSLVQIAAALVSEIARFLLDSTWGCFHAVGAVAAAEVPYVQSCFSAETTVSRIKSPACRILGVMTDIVPPVQVLVLGPVTSVKGSGI